MASGLRDLYPSIPPEEALAHLDAGPRADADDPRAQARSLHDWLLARGLRVPKQTLEARFVGAGAEHETYYDPEGALACKVTHDGRFGHCLREEGAVATPRDYLRRLVWHNQLFGDDFRLHGALEPSAGLRLVTSQPWIATPPGRPPPTQEELDAWLAAFGFARSTVYPDGFIYFNPEAGLVIGDAQPANVLIDNEGVLRPIDLVIAEPSPAFAARLLAAHPVS